MWCTRRGFCPISFDSSVMLQSRPSKDEESFQCPLTDTVDLGVPICPDTCCHPLVEVVVQFVLLPLLWCHMSPVGPNGLLYPPCASGPAVYWRRLAHSGGTEDPARWPGPCWIHCPGSVLDFKIKRQFSKFFLCVSQTLICLVSRNPKLAMITCDGNLKKQCLKHMKVLFFPLKLDTFCTMASWAWALLGFLFLTSLAYGLYSYASEILATLPSKF